MEKKNLSQGNHFSSCPTNYLPLTNQPSLPKKECAIVNASYMAEEIDLMLKKIDDSVIEGILKEQED